MITYSEKSLISLVSCISPSCTWGLFEGTGRCGWNAVAFILGGNDDTVGPRNVRYEAATAAVKFFLHT